MNEQAIVERIISDAENEARTIIEEAEKRAAETIAEASRGAERNKRGALAETDARAKSILDGKAATARLDGAKILLGEKRGVIDEIYSRALAQLVSAGKPETLRLAERLITENAEEGDELVFAENFRYAQEVAALDIVREKKLKVSPVRAKLDGGFKLIGKTSDKDLSYGAVLAVDREERQAEIAAKIFAN